MWVRVYLHSYLVLLETFFSLPPFKILVEDLCINSITLIINMVHSVMWDKGKKLNITFWDNHILQSLAALQEYNTHSCTDAVHLTVTATQNIMCSCKTGVRTRLTRLNLHLCGTESVQVSCTADRRLVTPGWTHQPRNWANTLLTCYSMDLPPNLNVQRQNVNINTYD